MKSAEIHNLSVEESQPQSFNKNKALRRQILYIISPILGSICHGITSRIMKNYLPDICESNPNERVIAETVADLVIPMAAIVCVLIMRCGGRILSLKLSFIPWQLGMFCTFFAENKWFKLIGFSLLWFSTTLNNTTSYVYAFEICEPRLQALAIVFLSISYHFGLLISDVFQKDYRPTLLFLQFSLANAFLLMFFCPETPNYLIQNNMMSKAKKNLFFIRGAEVEQQEFNLLLSSEIENAQNKKIWPKLFSKRFFKIFTVISFMFLVHVGPSTKVLKNQMVPPMDDLYKPASFLNRHQWLIVTDVTALSSAVLACFLITKTNRKSLFLFSASGVFLSLIILGILVKYESSSVIVIFFAVAGTWFVYIGIEQIPWIIATEIFPDSLRDIGIGLCTVYLFTLHALIWKLYTFITTSYGGEKALWVQAFIILVGSVTSYFIMPERKIFGYSECLHHVGKPEYSFNNLKK